MVFWWKFWFKLVLLSLKIICHFHISKSIKFIETFLTTPISKFPLLLFWTFLVWLPGRNPCPYLHLSYSHIFLIYVLSKKLNAREILLFNLHFSTWAAEHSLAQFMVFDLVGTPWIHFALSNTHSPFHGELFYSFQSWSCSTPSKALITISHR